VFCSIDAGYSSAKNAIPPRIDSTNRAAMIPQRNLGSFPAAEFDRGDPEDAGQNHRPDLQRALGSSFTPIGFDIEVRGDEEADRDGQQSDEECGYPDDSRILIGQGIGIHTSARTFHPEKSTFL